MKTDLLVILALFVALLLRGTAFCSAPRYPGVAGVGDDHQGGAESTQPNDAQAIQVQIQNAKGNLAIETKWELDPLSRPKFNLIPAADIGKYRYIDRYLFDLGEDEISHYFILQEDYVFRNLNGRFDKIPAGFIWDGASIPKDWGAIGLDVGNARYNSALAEGLIHDYMYRNPQRYTKKEADDLFYDNLKRCNNLDAMALYKVVDLHWEAAKTYQRHWDNQRRGYYAVFTPEFYAGNLKAFQDGNISIDTSKLEELLKEQIVFAQSLIAKGTKATNSEIGDFNSRQMKIRQEVLKVAKQVEGFSKARSVSDAEKKRCTDELSARLAPDVRHLISLMNQTVEKKIVDHLETISDFDAFDLQSLEASGIFDR